MSDSFQFKCPFCDQVMEVPSEMQGQVVNCPSCEEEIVPNQETAPNQKTAPDKLKPQTTATKKFSKVTQKTKEQIKFCPFCTEEVPITAKKCKHCHSSLKNTSLSMFASSLIILIFFFAGLFFLFDYLSIYNNAKSAIHQILAYLALLVSVICFLASILLHVIIYKR